MTYTAPSTLPTRGTDKLAAANAASSASVTADDSYDFSASPAQTVSGTEAAMSITLKTANGDRDRDQLAPRRQGDRRTAAPLRLDTGSPARAPLESWMRRGAAAR